MYFKVSSAKDLTILALKATRITREVASNYKIMQFITANKNT